MIPKHLKTFIPFLWALALWSFFFSAFKFFVWNDFQLLHIDLPKVAGFLSLGSVISYVFWGAFAYAFVKKYFLLFLSLAVASIITILYVFPVSHETTGLIAITLVGFLYGLWTVLRNIITAIEIEKTGFSDTFINGVAGTVFVIFIIIGAISWNLFFEHFQIKWYLFILLNLGILFCISLFLEYETISYTHLLKDGWHAYLIEKKRKVHTALISFFPELKYIGKHYFSIILCSSILWASSTAVSQQALEHSIIHFHKLPSEASFLLLYSAIGVIVGNIVSIKFEKRRWFYFFISSILYTLTILLFPFLASSYTMTIYLATIIGVFFWVSVNLLDAFYLHSLAKENKKEYGASTYGLFVSGIIFLVMILTSSVSHRFGLLATMITLAVLVILSSLYLVYGKKKWF